MYLKLFTRCNLLVLHTGLYSHVNQVHMLLTMSPPKVVTYIGVQYVTSFAMYFVTFAPFSMLVQGCTL